MADYTTQTVIHQDIPERLIAPFERLLLAQIFESDERDGMISYYAGEGPRDFIILNRRDVEDALSKSPVRSRLRSALLERVLKSDPGHDYFDFDLTSTAYASDVYIFILQDIVRRSKGELPYLTMAAAYTCSKMRADGFGGMAMIIMPNRVYYQSTYAFLEAFEKRQARKSPRQAAAP
jgi:hypothetical protein